MFAVEFTWNVYFEHVLESIINGIDKVNESVCGMEGDGVRKEGWNLYCLYPQGGIEISQGGIEISSIKSMFRL
jgi:hypothetical protein